MFISDCPITTNADQASGWIIIVVLMLFVFMFTSSLMIMARHLADDDDYSDYFYI